MVVYVRAYPNVTPSFTLPNEIAMWGWMMMKMMLGLLYWYQV